MKILVGFDASEGAQDALELAAVLHGLVAGEVLVVDVLPSEEPVPTPYRLVPSERLPAPPPSFDACAAALPGVELETRAIPGGSPARVLRELAESEEADLVVVGSPHRGALGRTFLGSVAAGLLHGAPVPIAVAPRGYRGRRHDRLRTIAVAYDGSAEAKLALAQARALATGAGAAVRVLTVAEPTVAMPGVGGYTPPPGFDAEKLVAEALAGLGPGLEKEGRQLAGPAPAALAEACEDGVDLLVTGSRGYGALGRVFAGSLASALIHRSPCPVLVVPRPPEPD